MNTPDLSPIFTLLQSAIIFLQLATGTPLESQARLMAVSAINTAQVAIQDVIAQQASSTSQTVPQTNPQPAPAPQPAPQQPPVVTPTPMNTLEIMSPIAGKGLGRTYVASEVPTDESNYIVLGLIIRTPEGDVTGTPVVKVTATDEAQNKDFPNGANFSTRIWENGNQVTVLHYQYRYNFKTPGEHVIKFESDGQSQEVRLQVEPAISS